MSQRELVRGFVVHGKEYLPPLDGRRDKRLGDELPALRFDNDALIGSNPQAADVLGVQLDVDFRRVKLAEHR